MRLKTHHTLSRRLLRSRCSSCHRTRFPQSREDHHSPQLIQLLDERCHGSALTHNIEISQKYMSLIERCENPSMTPTPPWKNDLRVSHDQLPWKDVAPQIRILNSIRRQGTSIVSRRRSVGGSSNSSYTREYSDDTTHISRGSVESIDVSAPIVPVSDLITRLGDSS